MPRVLLKAELPNAIGVLVCWRGGEKTAKRQPGLKTPSCVYVIRV